MANPVVKVALLSIAFSYALFTWVLYNFTFLRSGDFFKRGSEKEKLELEIARDRYWNLSKSPIEGFTHHFLALRSGFRFHYVSNESSLGADASKNLVIFLHGFPDSYVIWRKILASKGLSEKYTLIAVDLPGYGGTDGLEKYGPSEVLNALVEFVVAAREKYSAGEDSKTVIVAHDWGAVLALRLAAEAPQLADRFIVSNGPLVPLVAANVTRLICSASKMLKTFMRHPSLSLLRKALATVSPVAAQLIKSGYIFVFNMPPWFIRQIATGADMAFLRHCHRSANKSLFKADSSLPHAADAMAGTIGPGWADCKTATKSGEQYGKTILDSRAHTTSASFFLHQTYYYNKRVSSGKWEKSLEVIADLHSLENERGPSSSGESMIQGSMPQGSLRAPTTVIWGKDDMALDPKICLDGYAGYMVPKSQLVSLEGVGHWVPVDAMGAKAVETALHWEFASNVDAKSLEDVLKEQGVQGDMLISK